MVLADAQAEGDDWVAERVLADVTYLDALMGERLDLDTYLRRTQGVGADPWPAEYIDQRRVEAIDALADLGIGWGPNTINDLEDAEGRLSPAETAEHIERYAAELEPTVRRLVDTDAPMKLRIEEVEVDDYWSYWLDGAGADARLRINLPNAQFTKVRARQLALHELHGHALQGATYYQRAQEHDVPWVRILSVHAPQQSLLEGLAQAFPLFVTPDEPDLIARTRLTLYSQLVRAELHIRINGGHTPAQCVEYARSMTPFVNGAALADSLADRANNVLLRSYLWSYASGMDWFVRLHEGQPRVTAGEVLTKSFCDPLTPSRLQTLAGST
ncbi:MAG: hypothetical protein AAF657_30175 [Acidobacteriota bacterium]